MSVLLTPHARRRRTVYICIGVAFNVWFSRYNLYDREPSHAPVSDSSIYYGFYDVPLSFLNTTERPKTQRCSLSIRKRE